MSLDCVFGLKARVKGVRGWKGNVFEVRRKSLQGGELEKGSSLESAFFYSSLSLHSLLYSHGTRHRLMVDRAATISFLEPRLSPK